MASTAARRIETEPRFDPAAAGITSRARGANAPTLVDPQGLQTLCVYDK